jgi:adenylylsulfate kinase
VKCSLETCITRDPKGLYKKALSGEIKDLTGLQDPYEEPENPEIIVDTERQTVEECVNVILDRVLQGHNSNHGLKTQTTISHDSKMTK